MAELGGTWTFWLVLALQTLGIGSVLAARLSERTQARLAGQRFFLVSLLLVGVAALTAVHVGDATRFCFAATLPLMALGATLDLGQRSADALC